MPEQTYSIGFGKDDFFYSTEPEKLYNLLQTIPFTTDKFTTDKLIVWCNSKGGNISATSGTNNESIIFNSEISKIILENRNDFINNYMPGNISINNNFNSVALDLIASKDSPTADSVPIRGNVVITTNNNSIPKMYLDISSGSTLEYSTENGKWNQDISINAIIPQNTMLEYIPPAGPIKNTDGTNQQVTVSADTRNPRCKFVNNCTVNHGHFSSCRTETHTDTFTKERFCKCVCTGPMVSDGKPHTHCNEINIEDTATNGLDDSWVKKYMADTTLTSVLKDIKMNLKANFLNIGSSATAINGNLVANYNDSDQLKKTDLAIRETLYDYYAEIIKNRELQTNLMDNKTFNNTAKLISHDATQNYRKQYLELFNVTTGIFLASAYIYISMKSNS
jgi:hypothetical protein